MSKFVFTFLVFAGLAVTAVPAHAQIVPGWATPYGYNPYGYGPSYYAPHWPQTVRFPTIGYLPNGIRVIDPWNTYTANPPINYWAANWNAYAYNQQLYQQQLFNTYAATNPFTNGNFGGFAFNGLAPGFVPNGIQINREPGRFVRVGQDAAYNPISGTLLRPQSGIAFTQDGPFFRQPGTGTMTAWGAFIPGSGLYVNPFTGQTYNPQTGLIVRQ